MATRKAAKKEAAEILNRIATSLPLPASVEAYLRGYAAGLVEKRR